MTVPPNPLGVPFQSFVLPSTRRLGSKRAGSGATVPVPAGTSRASTGTLSCAGATEAPSPATRPATTTVTTPMRRKCECIRSILPEARIGRGR